MKKRMKHWMAMLLMVCMVIGMLPSAVSAKENTVDHIDIDQRLAAVVVYNGKTYNVEYTLTAADANDIQITASNGASFTRGKVSSSTDNAGNRQIRLEGTYPVGTKANPVRYTVSLTKTFTIATSEGNVQVPITLSITIGYWDSSNVCPPVLQNKTNWQKGSVIGNSGIDLKLSQTSGILYLQKNVEGIVLTEAQTYTFTVTNTSTNVSQNVNITVPAGGTTGAAVVAPLEAGEYTVEEISGGSINGYQLNVSYDKQTVTVSTSQPGSVQVTNQYVPNTVTVSGSKKWDDADNQDGKRPNSITIYLKANEEPIKTAVVSSRDNWSWSFEGLDKFDADGNEIVYTIEEASVTDYTTRYDGYNIVNTHIPENITISGKKTWDDGDNQDGIRPRSITVNVMNGQKKVASKTVSAADNWEWSFTLPKYENGQEIDYTIVEEAVNGYVSRVEGYDITNTHTPEVTSISGQKTWKDADNQDGIRPKSITVYLLADGVKVDSQTVTGSNGWTWTFDNKPVYKNGQKIVYTIVEEPVNGYVSRVEGFNITNTHTPEIIEKLSGSKTWDDADNQDNKRPDYIIVTLKANGVDVESKKVTAADGWSWTFTNQPKCENGQEIVYTVVESAVSDYSTQYDPNSLDITNSHTPAQTSVTVSKSWEDENNQDGIRPKSITVKLLADGIPTGDELVLSDENQWIGSFQNLDQYKAGKEIVYTIQEVAVDGYKSEITGNMTDGFTITNVHEPEVVSVSGFKTWDDAENQDGNRPEKITIRLLADGVEAEVQEVTAATQWTWHFDNLPKNNAGEEIEYTIVEDAVADYSVSYDGYNVKNSYTPKQTSITVSKVWKDGDNLDKIRPDSVTIKLLANGQDTGKTLTLTADGQWKGSFTKMDMYENGQAIVYTIEEVKVDGYTSSISGDAASGFVVINVHNVTPKMGDNSNILLYSVLLGVSVVAMTGLLIIRRKRKA